MPQKEWQKFYDSFDIKPLRRPRTCLLRWNPKISSYTLEQYRYDVKYGQDGFTSDWSVYEWEEANEGDRFYMLRTGDDKPGIVYRGVFTSNPYEGEDWAGSDRVRYYVDMDCYDCVPADEQSPITIEVLEKAIPNVNWRAGHSGEYLSEEDAEKLDELWEKYMK